MNQITLLTVPDVARLTGNVRSNVLKWVYSGRLQPVPGLKPLRFFPSSMAGLPRKTFVSHDDVAAFLWEKQKESN
jgi:hypothetical protein